MRIPSAFFVDPRLGAADISVARPHYDAALQKLRSRLPETPGRVDADHGWLTPVKAHSDIVAVDALVEQGTVDKEFVADVLAVDFTNPVFSKTRCGLLKLVPDKGGADFVARFQDALRGASVPGASELLANLSDPARNAAFHEKQRRCISGKLSTASGGSRCRSGMVPPAGATPGRGRGIRDFAESKRAYSGGAGSDRLPVHPAEGGRRASGADAGAVRSSSATASGLGRGLSR